MLFSTSNFQFALTEYWWLPSKTVQDRAEEAGDLLFAAVNLVRAHGVAAEEALRAANAKFERRFRAMEAMADRAGTDFSALSLDDQEALWQVVKRAEKAPAAPVPPLS